MESPSPIFFPEDEKLCLLGDGKPPEAERIDRSTPEGAGPRKACHIVLQTGSPDETPLSPDVEETRRSENLQGEI